MQHNDAGYLNTHFSLLILENGYDEIQSKMMKLSVVVATWTFCQGH